MNFGNISISEWKEAPPMDTGAPMPSILSIESDLFVSYIISTENEKNELYAIVKFSGVMQHTFGYPNDEALGAHPLYDSGLEFYSFNLVENSPYLKELDDRNSSIFPEGKGMYCERFKHYIVTFHDETLEVIASSISYMTSESAENSHEAISKYLKH